MPAIDHPRNILLAALPPPAWAAVAPHLTREALDRDQVLIRARERIREVWFPEGGIASVASRNHDGQTVEIGLLGREGTTCVPLLLGSDTAPHDVFMQVNGATGLRMDALRFLAAADAVPAFRAVMLRYVYTILAQTSESAMSNARQRMEARLARWLLMCHDRMEGDEIPLTHRFMAMMVAAERSSVTVSLHVLEGAGLIRSTRGRVLITDRERLEDLAGDGYGACEHEYRRLIAPFGKGPRAQPAP